MMQRRTSLARRSPMRRSVHPTVPPELRAQLAVRSGGWCEARLPGCTGRATDAAHRISRKMGGRPLGDDARLSNMLHLCRACHSWCHARPAEAKDFGLMLDEHQDPSLEPMAYLGAGWVHLDDDGGLWPAYVPDCAP